MSFSIQNGLGYWANRLANAMWSDLNAELSELGVTPAQWGVLGLLADIGQIGVVELARQLGIDRAAVSRQIALLERAGMVTRNKHPKDNRQIQIVLTDKGRDLMPELQQRSDRVNAQWLTHLQPEEAEQLMKLLKKAVSRTV